MDSVLKTLSQTLWKKNLMSRYKDIPMSQRIEKIGELLAKGIYLCLKEQKKEIEKSPDSCDNINCSESGDPSVAGSGIGKTDNQLD